MASMNDKDYYAILGVSPDASAKEIQKAFQQKARKLHPDINKAPDAEEQFKAVSEAYAVLSDEQKRARYDAMRSGSPFAGASGSSSGSGFPFGGGFPFTDFPFGAATRRGPSSSPYNPENGADFVIDINLTAEQAKNGTRQAVTYQRLAPCPSCGGVGTTCSEHSHVCPTCSGSGSIGIDLQGLTGMPGVIKMVCPECGGAGRVVSDPCPDCSGTGRVSVASEVVVEFPAHTHDGDVVRLSKKGHAGTNGAGSGDLVARARVESERLDGKGALGFSILGFALAFILVSAVAGALSVFAVLCAIPVVFGLYLVLSDNVRSRSLLWWKRGLRQVVNGAAQGFLTALILVSFVSCTQSVLLGPYAFM